MILEIMRPSTFVVSHFLYSTTCKLHTIKPQCVYCHHVHGCSRSIFPESPRSISARPSAVAQFITCVGNQSVSDMIAVSAEELAVG